MVYLYSDPLVHRVDNELVANMNDDLDTDNEYIQMVNDLKFTKKQFTIDKYLFNMDTFSKILAKQPSIIHVSCHGAFDSLKR